MTTWDSMVTEWVLSMSIREAVMTIRDHIGVLVIIWEHLDSHTQPAMSLMKSGRIRGLLATQVISHLVQCGNLAAANGFTSVVTRLFIINVTFTMEALDQECYCLVVRMLSKELLASIPLALVHV